MLSLEATDENRTNVTKRLEGSRIKVESPIHVVAVEENIVVTWKREVQFVLN